MPTKHEFCHPSFVLPWGHKFLLPPAEYLSLSHPAGSLHLPSTFHPVSYPHFHVGRGSPGSSLVSEPWLLPTPGGIPPGNPFVSCFVSCCCPSPASFAGDAAVPGRDEGRLPPPTPQSRGRFGGCGELGSPGTTPGTPKDHPRTAPRGREPRPDAP